MSSLIIRRNSTGLPDLRVRVRLLSTSTGQPLDGLTFSNSPSGVQFKYATRDAITFTPITLVSASVNYTVGAFRGIGDGYYELDLPIAAASGTRGGTLVVTGSLVQPAAGAYICPEEDVLTPTAVPSTEQIWSHPTRSLTTAISASVDASAVATSVWSFVSRSLTLPVTASVINSGAIATSVWTNATRTLTSTGATASVDLNAVANAVWAAPTRSLTTAISTTVDTASIALGVWSFVSRSLTVSSSATVDTGSIATGVWNFVSRTLTSPVSASVINSGAIATTVWTNSTRTLTSIDTASVATGVWNFVSRSLTTGVAADTASIATAVWNHISRTLTSFETSSIVQGVWNAQRSAHTTAGSFGEGVASVRGNVFGNVTGSVGVVNSLGPNAITSSSLQLSATQRIANDLLDLANSVENNISVRNALRLMAATLGGVTNGAGTSTITFSSAGAGGTVRVLASVNTETGERETVTLNL